MQNHKSLETELDIDETLQTDADDSRLLLIGLRTHDSETTDAAMMRIAEKHGDSGMISILTNTMEILNRTEGWSFEDEN